MSNIHEITLEISKNFKNTFKKQGVILSFEEFLEKVMENPKALTRSSAQYMLDTFDHFGIETHNEIKRFKLFDLGKDKDTPIIGNHRVHAAIYQTLKNFVRQDVANKLILLHGPNGSSKTSTVETIANAMNLYSQTDEGAVYGFNWIFPVGKDLTPRGYGESGPVGFATRSDSMTDGIDSFAKLDEDQISSKIHSEYKENPIFLLPMPFREEFLRQAFAKQLNIEPKDVHLPHSLLNSGLSKRNKLIAENLSMAYDGDLTKVFRHVQIERFYYSKQYRVGISCVEPQMSLDAREAQLTMDKNISNLPSILHNIRFHEASGQLVEANRGMLEFSDLFKRPLEAFKYLLTMIENKSLNLPSSTTYLDIVFIASSNEKHLDAFKTVPDFTSFRERFELVTVPYLVESFLEQKIYEKDITTLKLNYEIAPHTLEYLCHWATMTRFKQPDPDSYNKELKPLIAKLEPIDKLKLYNNLPLSDKYTETEANQLRRNKTKVLCESEGMVIYEGRFGASPREIRSILHRCAESHQTLTPMTIFKELKRICRDRTIYEFLQFEPRGKYHDALQFIKDLEADFAYVFESEVLDAMEFVEEVKYEDLLSRYVQNVVAFIKNEKLYDSVTGSYIQASEKLMTEVEKILNTKSKPQDFRQSLINRIAAYKLENKDKDIDIRDVFRDILKQIKEHYYSKKKEIITTILQDMVKLDTDDAKDLDKEKVKKAETTYKRLESSFGYSRESARECIVFLLSHKK